MTSSMERAPRTPTSEAALPRLEPQRHAVIEGDLLAGLDRPQRHEIEGERREVADERAVRRRGVVDEARVAERNRGPALLPIEVLADRAGLPQKDVVSDVRRIDGAALFVGDDQHRRTLDERALLDPAVGDNAAPAALKFHDPQRRPLPAMHREIARPAAYNGDLLVGHLRALPRSLYVFARGRRRSGQPNFRSGSLRGH